MTQLSPNISNSSCRFNRVTLMPRVSETEVDYDVSTSNCTFTPFHQHLATDPQLETPKPDWLPYTKQANKRYMINEKKIIQRNKLQWPQKICLAAPSRAYKVPLHSSGQQLAPHPSGMPSTTPNIPHLHAPSTYHHKPKTVLRYILIPTKK